MLAQGSSACACAAGMQSGASNMLAAADATSRALFITFPFSDPYVRSVALCPEGSLGARLAEAGHCEGVISRQAIALSSRL